MQCLWQTSDDKTNLKNFQSRCASPLCELFLSFSLGQNTPFSILCFLAFYVLAAIHSQAFSTSTILSSTWPLHTSWFAAYLQSIFCPGYPPLQLSHLVSWLLGVTCSLPFSILFSQRYRSNGVKCLQTVMLKNLSQHKPFLPCMFLLGFFVTAMKTIRENYRRCAPLQVL